MIVYKLETSDATFKREMTRGGHFAIDCACGGKNGSHYKNAERVVERLRQDYEPLDLETKFEHTFYFNESLFLDSLVLSEMSKNPLVIVCNNCSREFPFTQATYKNLVNSMNLEDTALKPLQL